MKLRLSPEAARAIREIEDFTADRWGTVQAEKYLRELRAAFDRLIINPRLGRLKTSARLTYLAYNVASHVVIYRVEEGGIEVVAILHQSMDVVARLNAARRQP